MSACCVSGCKKRHSSTSKLKLYRIPSGSRPFQANRRRLWLQAIQEVNGSTVKGNARVCGAHFISGEASMDHDSPDFVPSVFTSMSSKKKVKRVYGRRKRWRPTAEAETEAETTPPRVDSPVDLQSSVLMEEMQTPSTPSGPMEEERFSEEAETEPDTSFKSQTTSSPHKVSPSFKVLDNRIPIVRLKPVFAPAGGYQCELCDQNFTDVSHFVKHKRVHDEESSYFCETCGKLFTSQADFTEHQCVHEAPFPCNMCDRSFTTSHNLKRHKLLHVKDGRKCSKCGVLFCLRHNHVLFLPQTKSEQDLDSEQEEENVSSDLMPENDLLEEPEPNQISDLDGDSPLLKTFPPEPPRPGPLTKTRKACYPRKKIPIPSSMPPPPIPMYPRNSGTSYHRRPLPDYPADFIQPHLPQPELPPSLRMFSPQFLTSALLQVKRNYDYILSKPGDVKKGTVTKKKVTVKEEEKCEQLVISPDELQVEHIKEERTAYDLEVVV